MTPEERKLAMDQLVEQVGADSDVSRPPIPI